MNRERLEHLMQTLEAVHARNVEQGHDHFDMGEWSRGTLPADEDNTHRKAGCGTVACALGWEATTGYANKRGLRLNRDGWPVVTTLPHGVYAEGFSAGEEYFKLGSWVAASLFSGSQYRAGGTTMYEVGPLDVRKRVAYLLEVGEDAYYARLTEGVDAGTGYHERARLILLNASQLPGGWRDRANDPAV